MKVGDSTTSMDGELVSNDQAKISIINSSLDYACYSVFEGMRCNYNDKTKVYAIFRLDDHVNRFFNSICVEKIDFRFSKKDVRNAIIATCEEHIRKYGDNGNKSIYIRPKTFLEDGIMGLNQSETPVHYAVSVWHWGAYHKDNVIDSGIGLIVSPQRKSLDELERWRVKSSHNYGRYGCPESTAAKRAGFADALLLDSKGFVAEAASSNIFCVKNGSIMTPDDNAAILHGITRDSVIQLMSKKYKVEKTNRLTLEHLYNMDELFLTGTAARIVPVTSITDLKGKKHKIGNGKPGHITRAAYELYMQAINGELTEFSHWRTPVKSTVKVEV